MLPINSCVNPFLYTFYVLISDRHQRKHMNSKNNRPANIDMGTINTISQLEP